MKTYNFTFMSIGPDESEEDNHQKYGVTADGENEENAKINAKIIFAEDNGDLPIFWIKCNGEVKQ